MKFLVLAHVRLRTLYSMTLPIYYRAPAKIWHLYSVLNHVHTCFGSGVYSKCTVE